MANNLDQSIDHLDQSINYLTLELDVFLKTLVEQSQQMKGNPQGNSGSGGNTGKEKDNNFKFVYDLASATKNIADSTRGGQLDFGRLAGTIGSAFGPMGFAIGNAGGAALNSVAALANRQGTVSDSDTLFKQNQAEASSALTEEKITNAITRAIPALIGQLQIFTSRFIQF